MRLEPLARRPGARRTPGRLLWLLPLLAFSPRPAAAENPACNQARAIIEEVERLYGAPAPDHALILQRLSTARDLCSALGEAWKYSYCSATALGDAKSARIFRDRALFNGIDDLSCPTPGGPASPPPSPLPSYVHAKHALVVGIGQFRDPAIPRLRFAAKDARDLAAVLTDPRYGRFDPANVTLLTDGQATRAAILNALQDLFLRAREDDLVLLYVSTHGSPRQADSGLGGVGYIVTYDTALANIWVDALDYEGFSRRASLIKSRRKVVFLDTCYSGQISLPGEKALLVEGSGVDSGTARRFLSGEGTYVITSSRGNETSFESETLQNSYFTHSLIQALEREGDPPTVQEVFDRLSREVPDIVAREKQKPQHPQLLPLDGHAAVRIGVAPLAGASGPPPP